MRQSYWLLYVLTLTGALSVSSQTVSAKDINWSLIRAVSRQGPFQIDLRDQVSFRVPTGYRFVSEDKLRDFHQLMEDVALPDEVGVILPEEGGWVAVLTFPKTDPMQDQNPAELNADQLFQWNVQVLEEIRPKRISQGMPALTITGWTHKPVYDAEAKKLTMGMRVSEEGDRNDGKKDELYYKVILYGPENNFICMQTTTQIGNWDRHLELTGELTTEFNFHAPGEYSSADDPLYYAKIGGAGLGVVAIVYFLARMFYGAGAPPQQRSNARRFGAR